MAARAVQRRRLRPRHRLRHRLRPRRSRLQPERTEGLEGPSGERLPRRPLRPLRRDVGADHPRHGERGGLRHGELHQPRRDRVGRPSRRSGHAVTDRWRTADHQRPAVPQHGPPTAAARVRAEADRTVGARDPTAVPGTARRDRRHHAGRDRSSTPPSSTRRTSPSASSAGCSASRPRTRSCSASSSTT